MSSARVWLAVVAIGLAACGSTNPTAATTSAPPTPSPTNCVNGMASNEQVPSFVHYEQMTVDNRLRDYRVIKPASLDGLQSYPLMLLLHGRPDDAAGLETVIHFDAAAATIGVLAVEPDGCDMMWDPSAGSYDVQFISALIDRLKTEYPVDRSRVYLVGASNGGTMAYRLACDLTDRFAAMASVVGSMPFGDCHPTRPLSILEMHGTKDLNVPYANALAAVHDWAALDGCSGDPKVTLNGITQTSLWSQCRDGVVVRLDTVEGGHHTWFGSDFDPIPGEPSSTQTIWNFFTSLAPRA